MNQLETMSFHARQDLWQDSIYANLGEFAIATPRTRTIQRWELSYRFESHFHPYVTELMERLIEGSVRGLQDADTDYRRNPDGSLVTLPDGRPKPTLHDDLLTAAAYAPGPMVEQPYPIQELALGSGAAYAVYNWEVFFHIPLTIGIHLSRSGRFEEAQRWLHYIFDPTDDSDGATPERFWKFRRFRTTDVKLLEEILLNLSTGADPVLLQETVNSILAWKEAPFRPHVVARYRPSAFMFKTVIAYLDNLIAWGDSLFRQDTRETINEATQLYVLAANILGPRPQVIPKKKSVRPRTYADFRGRLDALSNALASLETEVPHDALGDPDSRSSNERTGVLLDSGASLYFCVPRNQKLLEYWKTVADRLFKIRNSLSIRGIFRQLALFDPPIDPALLARAAAAGLDVGAIIAGLNQPLPLVRFRFLVQKALELAGEVRSLGQSLLAALQQEDGEALALLRARHEETILGMAETVRYAQLQEATKNREGIEQSIANAFERYRHYERLLGRDDGDLELPEWEALDTDALERMRLRSQEPPLPLREVAIRIDESAEGPTGGRMLSPGEALELSLQSTATDLRLAASIMDMIGGNLSLLPEFGGKMQPMGGGADLQFGGRELSTMFSLMGNNLRTAADVTAAQAGRTGRIAGYERREQEWALQGNVAVGELGLLFKQLRAAEIREAIAEKELENHRQQMQYAEEIRTFLEDEKTTGKEFYAWMKREVQGLYSQSYELAFDLAKKAERALQYELGDRNLSFVGFGHLAGKEGLLAGEKLALEVRRMELDYHDLNRREYELTTNVSLRQLDPFALLKLRATGSCTIVLPEEVFDLECPGHYFRRIRSVALSIPSIVGPYGGVHARLTLTKSRVRVSPLTTGANGEFGWEGPEDARFSDHYGSVQSIVTSTAQRDGGFFEPEPGDERYLPFEGAGAISEWSLELPTEFRTFDYGTIADVILHVRYTAREGGRTLATAATDSLTTRIEEAAVAGQTQLLSVRHEFPSEWAQFRQAAIPPGGAASLGLRLAPEHYPFWARGRVVALESLVLVADTDKAAVKVFANADGSGAADDLVRDPSRGDLRIGTLANVPTPAPLGAVDLHLDDNSMRELWLALTWRSV